MALEWVLGIATLLLPALILVAIMPGWAAARAMAATAAREAARTAAVHDDVAAAQAAGIGVAEEVAANHSLAEHLGAVDVAVPDVDANGQTDRAGVIRASVTVVVPAVALPLAGEMPTFSITAAHDEPLAPLRSREPQ